MLSKKIAQKAKVVIIIRGRFGFNGGKKDVSYQIDVDASTRLPNHPVLKNWQRGMFNFHRRRNRRKEAPLPAKELRIHQRYVLRLNSYQHWQKRILILTKDDLLVGIEGHDFVIERIPLVILSFLHFYSKRKK